MNPCIEITGLLDITKTFQDLVLSGEHSPELSGGLQEYYLSSYDLVIFQQLSNNQFQTGKVFQDPVISDEGPCCYNSTNHRLTLKVRLFSDMAQLNH
jgi:hypothetical protein